MVEVEGEDCISVAADGVLSHQIAVDHNVADCRVQEALIEDYFELSGWLFVGRRLWKIRARTRAKVSAAAQAGTRADVRVILRIGIIIQADLFAHVVDVGVGLSREVAFPEVGRDIQVRCIEPVEKFTDNLDLALLRRRTAINYGRAVVTTRNIVACCFIVDG
jgi:hypothetical protein